MTVSLSVFVRSFVRPLFFSLVSLKSVAHLECYKASKSVKGIHWESICISRVFQECFKCVARVFQRKFHGSFKRVSKEFPCCFSDKSFEGDLRAFQRSFKDISGVFQRS